MNSLLSKLSFFCLFVLPTALLLANEENFVLLNGISNEIIIEIGPHTHERITPCSTFKIPLSLIGYDANILVDKNNPIWDFKEGYDVYLDSWKTCQTPQSWMKNSCVWYSRLLTQQLGFKKLQEYVSSLHYGNEDLSGGLTTAWLSSSLQISPHEQVIFLQNMIQEKFSISKKAIQVTKSLLFLDELTDGWQLFGKTGMGSVKNIDGNKLEIGWFIGWIEKDNIFYPFAYNIRGNKINPTKRIPRVRELLLPVVKELSFL